MKVSEARLAATRRLKRRRVVNPRTRVDSRVRPRIENPILSINLNKVHPERDGNLKVGRRARQRDEDDARNRMNVDQCCIYPIVLIYRGYKVCFGGYMYHI